MKLSVSKSEINYEIMGEGRPIILFSGFMNDMTVMIKTMEPIFENKTNWKRIYVDHLGVGDTLIGEDVKTVNDVLDTMLEFVDKVVGDENFVVCGYSFGGFLSRYILDKRFDKVDGILLITPLTDANLEKIEVDRTIKVVQYVDEQKQQEIDNKLQTYFYGAMEKSNVEYLQNLMAVSSSYNITLDNFDKFTKPTLIITGRQDSDVGYKNAYKIIEKYPRATYISMDKCGHASQIEQEVIFKTLINEWIYRLEEETNR